MINTPVDAMRPLIVNEFYKHGKFTDVFMGCKYKKDDVIINHAELDKEISKMNAWLEKGYTDLQSSGRHRGKHFWNAVESRNKLIQMKELGGTTSIPIEKGHC